MTMETTCNFCCRNFARSDALKRHWSTCKVRIDHRLDIPVLETKTRGRKARACDRCSRAKRACDSEIPCAPCKSNREKCSYLRLQYKLGNCSERAARKAFQTSVNNDSDSIAFQSTASDSPPMFFINNSYHVTSSLLNEHALGTSIVHPPTQIDMVLLAQFPFLENHTRSTGFVSSFQCGTANERLRVIENLANSNRSRDCSIGSVQEPQLTSDWIETSWNALMAYNSHQMRDIEAKALMTKTHEIVSEIRKNTIAKHHESSVRLSWSISLEASCYEFFNPIALQRYLALFWSFWHPNWPVIHRPTFDVQHKSPLLVAALALIGACLSPNLCDRANSKTWFNSVEEMVFGEEVFFQYDISAAWRDVDQKNVRIKHLEILQAAYIVCLYQTWEGENQSRRRILRNRFNSLVYFTRDVGIAEASLNSVITSVPYAFDWEEYALRESLIRLNCYICGIDASYALLFRHVPRMSLSELVMELPSPESCFQARSREECYLELKNWRTRYCLNDGPITLRTAVEILSDPGKMQKSKAHQQFLQLSVLSMFTIVHVLYAMVHCMPGLGLQSYDAIMSSPAAIALQQWGRFWQSWSRDREMFELALKGRQSSTVWQSIGFIKHAPEYWLLSRLFLNQLAKKAAGASTWELESPEQNDGNMNKARAMIMKLIQTASALLH